jgi:hypothetical protein
MGISDIFERISGALGVGTEASQADAADCLAMFIGEFRAYKLHALMWQRRDGPLAMQKHRRGLYEKHALICAYIEGYNPRMRAAHRHEFACRIIDRMCAPPVFAELRAIENAFASQEVRSREWEASIARGPYTPCQSALDVAAREIALLWWNNGWAFNKSQTDAPSPMEDYPLLVANWVSAERTDTEATATPRA